MPETNANESRLLIKGATVLTMDPTLGDLTTGDILIVGDRISAVAAELSDPQAEVIDARGMIAIPGLIDTHMHAWQTPLKGLHGAGWTFDDYQSRVFYLREHFGVEDIHDATLAGSIEMLDAGVTGVLDFCHNVMSPQHAEAALRAHRGTGQRTLWAYGMLSTLDGSLQDDAWRLEHIREMRKETGDGGLLRIGMALASIERGSMDQITTEIGLARELGMQMTVHQNPAGQIRELHQAGLLGGDIVPAHSNAADNEELELIADCGGSISFTPECEFAGGRSMTVLNRAHRAGVASSLGIDTPARVPIDMFNAMRLTFMLMRSVEAVDEREAGRYPLTRRPGTPMVEPRHMLEYATVNGARAIGLGDDLGRLAPRQLADIVLINPEPYGVALGDPAAHVVLRTQPRDVDTVIVGGAVRKRDGKLTDLDRDDAGAATRRVRERIFADVESAPQGVHQ
ncbi:amidohydrolase family protein [Streptomyces albipurpureus]|uniref:Amidohydrolase family protein n=1 Tax=Streptomyces albipurpureus TaxID=2897419 RepID=A0ABT0UF70_9ACTN|nr:amidohydrolase family protein [Streptomyces sp. CWNU-1]MCM2387247.1 amidohydrolase family protein [Streptomyces sp. CWNU-1]